MLIELPKRCRALRFRSCVLLTERCWQRSTSIHGLRTASGSLIIRVTWSLSTSLRSRWTLARKHWRSKLVPLLPSCTAWAVRERREPVTCQWHGRRAVSAKHSSVCRSVDTVMHEWASAFRRRVHALSVHYRVKIGAALQGVEHLPTAKTADCDNRRNVQPDSQRTNGYAPACSRRPRTRPERPLGRRD